MLDRLLSLLSGTPSPSVEPPTLKIAVAALLVEAARMDNAFATEEQRMIEALIETRFGLSPEESRRVIEAGEKASQDSVHMLRFTRPILDGMEPEQRVEVIEMLWDVAYADGVLEPEEDALIAKVAGLIFVSASDRSAARKRVLERRKRKGPWEN